MGAVTKPQRSSNFELYRIIVMFMIICHHYVVNSGLSDVLRNNPTSAHSMFYFLFGAWGKTGINCFVLITGYFMCKSNITLRKFLKLYLQVIFYNIIIDAIFIGLGYAPFNPWLTIYRFLPFTHVHSWFFVDCYLLFWLLIPFLNILVHNMTKRQHKLLIFLLLFIYTGLETLPGCIVVMNYVSWFSVLYFISSYLRLYPTTLFNKTKTWGIATCALLVIACADIVRLKGDLHHVSDSNAIFALLISVSSFLFFKNLRIPQSKIINAIASTTFGILLIHANSNTMWEFLWHDTVDCVGHYSATLWYAPLSVLAIFMVCSLIDYIRQQTIEASLIDTTEKLVKRIQARFNKH